jgi:hypothetical protein
MAVALFTLVAASPTPGGSGSPTSGLFASPTPGTSASPTPVKSASPSATNTVVLVGYLIDVARGSVLHLQSSVICPVIPKGTKGSTNISVTARIVSSADAAGSYTASGVVQANPDRSWKLDVPVPVDAKLGSAVLTVWCHTGAPAVVYYKYAVGRFTIIDPAPADSSAALLALCFGAGLVLGLGVMWLAPRGLSRIRKGRASTRLPGSTS